MVFGTEDEAWMKFVKGCVQNFSPVFTKVICACVVIIKASNYSYIV